MQKVMESQENMKKGMGLRVRKKMLARTAIEEAALQLFHERGYENTSIEDIAETVVMSSRTFFRYFSSKEDVLFAPWQEMLAMTATLLAERPPEESLYASFCAIFSHLGTIYQVRREHALRVYQVVKSTPSLIPGYLYQMASIEPTICGIIARRPGNQMDDRQIPLLVAAVMGAFRVALQAWSEQGATNDLSTRVQENLEQLKQGFFHCDTHSNQATS